MTHRRDWTPEQARRYGDGNGNRDTAGVIATLTDGQVIHRKGLAFDAVREIAAYCDRYEVQVVTLSTPRTIAADLRVRGTYLNGLAHRTGVNTPEQVLLGRVGRIDLCATEPYQERRRR